MIDRLPYVPEHRDCLFESITGRIQR